MRVLFVCSNPRSTQRLDLGDEMREILASLKGQEVDFMLLPAAQRLDLKTTIASNDIDILHFSGHGSIEEGLILRDEDGMDAPVAGTELHELLAKTDRPIKLVVLNACNTQGTAAAIEGSVGAIVCTEKEVVDDAARTLTRVLYSQLAQGNSIEQSCSTAQQYIREIAPEEDVYVLRGDSKDVPLFEKPEAGGSAEEATINIEGKTSYDRYFFIDYLDGQIQDITKRIRFNRRLFPVLLFAGLLFFGMMMFQYELAMQFYNFVKVSFLGPERFAAVVESNYSKPYLDAMIALGATIPAFLAFLQTRLSIHGNERLNSLNQMKELAKASDSLPVELRERLHKIIDQCIRGSGEDDKPPGWFNFLKAFQQDNSDTGAR